MLSPAFIFSLVAIPYASAAITVYNQIPFGQSTQTSASPGATVAAAYNTTLLTPPTIPNPAPATQFTLELQVTTNAVSSPLSIPQSGSFYGFSIEMSVVTQVLGKNSSFLQVPFLNLMANMAERGGSVRVRTGGNTQDYAAFAYDIPNSFGKCVGKEAANISNPTETPAVLYNMDYFYLLSNISSLVKVGWYLGIPFNDSSNFRLQIAEFSEAILGDNLLGLQIGNEPDLYVAHGHRPSTYGPFDYFGEVSELVQIIAADSNIPVKNKLIGPSVSGTWTPEMVWDTGFIPTFSSSLTALAVEHYPDNNCFAIYGVGSPVDPQTEFPKFLTHQSGQSIVAPYLNSTSIAVAAGLPFLMFETNSASCGGFPGISDSFGAALWALDYGLQMAYSNFSGAMLHVGGQNVFYNPFTPPPTNQSTYHQWTIGAVYYSAMIVAETLGSSNTAQITDLQGNSANQFTPQYAIYENGNLAKVALFNYINDPSGASDYNATLHLNGGTVPDQVSVKYLLSDSVSTKDNITWANQTFGTQFTVDGRLQGDLFVYNVPCDTTANTCVIAVPAPGFALVFLSSDTFNEVTPSSPTTFSTTAYTKLRNTATIDASVLATSNGMSGKDWQALSGSTSHGSAVSSAPQKPHFGTAAWTMVLLLTTYLAHLSTL